MPPPLTQAVSEEIIGYFVNCEDTKFVHAATAVSVLQINAMRHNWETNGEVTPTKHLDQGKPRSMSSELMIFLTSWSKDPQPISVR